MFIRMISLSLLLDTFRYMSFVRAYIVGLDWFFPSTTSMALVVIELF